MTTKTMVESSWAEDMGQFFYHLFLSRHKKNNKKTWKITTKIVNTVPSFVIKLDSWVECSPMARGTGAQSQVESYQKLKKRYLIPPCLTLSIMRCVLRVKCSNPGKGVTTSPTPRFSSYWKGSFLVALNYSC